MPARAPSAALTRAGRPPPPVRLVHLGLGGFHRAHQAWYTQHAADAAEWGIAAFTGRSTDLAERLARQDGLYTLVERAAGGDRFEVIRSIAEARPGTDVERLRSLVARPSTAAVTLTITEVGYAVDAGAEAPLVAAGAPTTALGRLLVALERRRETDAGPIALVPCDNLPDNARVLRDALAALAERLPPGAQRWLEREVAVVGTVVDRITPAPDGALEHAVEAAQGYRDAAPVATEPFTEWVLSGPFPAGRPAWESAGARFVDDVAPWQRRKLWLLNGAHTLLAAAGPLLGHETVAEAIADPVLHGAVEAQWDEAARHLPLPGLADYRRALLDRFGNPRIAHRLAQIGQDAPTKLRLRVVPVALLERRAGRDAAASCGALGAWIALSGDADVRASLAALDPALAADAGLVDAVTRAAREWERLAAVRRRR